jgi:hypothetical protein
VDCQRVPGWTDLHSSSGGVIVQLDLSSVYKPVKNEYGTIVYGCLLQSNGD